MGQKSSPQLTHRSALNGLPGQDFSHLAEARAGQPHRQRALARAHQDHDPTYRRELWRGMTAMGTLRFAHPTGRPHTPPTPPVMPTPHVIDDSDQAIFGYSYTPGEQVQEVLDQGSR